MAVVARLTCHSVESFVGSQTMKLSPVIGTEDPHDEEIKAFFEATPSGNVSFTVAAGEAPYKAGDQVYLEFETSDTPGAAKVTSVKLQGWATFVEMECPWDVKPHLKASFTIRNAVAAEQFQVGSTHKFALRPVNA